MGDFRKLKVFEKGHPIAIRVHRLAKAMRDSRFLSLRNQMIRAAESIPTNIVEASRQSSNRDFARFLGYSVGSATELEYQLTLARDIEAAPADEASTLIADVVEVRRMLYGLIRRVTKPPPPKDKKRHPRRRA
jgi:four helix bundle protein